ncbi:MAG: gfo/Idh/MocA family oxidoreductase, partial [Verrucomicrobiae bacterium]|nr:gfo/Idh/MocA family oxidoreductase [Verrucomicrobiae bacterium]NNJ85778.1 gfo/Idh/MocA family oxidoreductase [Akkermansiaceae bacterium]
MTTPNKSRRRFLKQSALAAGFPLIAPASVLGLNGKVAPSNRIVVGGIGLGPRGRVILKRFLKQKDCQFVAIADPQSKPREGVRRITNRHYDNQD